MTDPDYMSARHASVDGGESTSSRATVGARMALRYCDAAFVLCAAATIVLWSAGISAGRFAVVVVAWCLTWVWWATRRPLTVWAPIIAVGVTFTIWSQHVPDVAFAASRGCLDRVADIELDGGVDEWSDIRLRNLWTADDYRTNTEPGHCGLIRWRDSYVVEAATANGDEEAVVFAAAGQTHHLGLLDVVQHGLVRVDGGPPATCSTLVGNDRGESGNGCLIGDLGGGWYWFSNWWASGAN